MELLTPVLEYKGWIWCYRSYCWRTAAKQVRQTTVERSWGVPVHSLRHSVTSSLHTTHKYSCLHILPPTHALFTLYEAPEKMDDVLVATFQTNVNLFWSCNFSVEHVLHWQCLFRTSFHVWSDCFNTTLLVGRAGRLITLGQESLLGSCYSRITCLFFFSFFSSMHDSNVCVFSCAICCRWSSTQPVFFLLFFFPSTGRSIGPMNTFYRSWYFDLHVGGVNLAASLFFLCSVFSWAWHFSAVVFFFLFFFSLTHTTGSRKNKVCLLSMFMVTSRRGTTRVEREERKKVRVCCRCAAAWGKYLMCEQHYLICRGSSVLLLSLELMTALSMRTCAFSWHFFWWFFPSSLPSSSYIPLHWHCCAEFIFQPVNVL